MADDFARRAAVATACSAALIAYAEAACALAESGAVDPPSDRSLRAAVRGVHPVHHDRADLVALALARAWAAGPTRRTELA